MSVDRLLGVSLLSLVAEDDVANCLAALGEASSMQSGITLHLDIRTAQELLGHADVRATLIYTHVMGKGAMRVKSPLDR